MRYSLLLNDLQTLIWAGALLYVLLRWNSRNLYELMGAVVFLGGYLFHMIWESGASYTIPYFAALIPYAVCGMAEWVEFMEKRIAQLRGMAHDREGNAPVREEGPSARGRKRKLLMAAAAAAFFLLVAAFTRTNLFDRTIALNDDLQGSDASDQFYQRGIWKTDY